MYQVRVYQFGTVRAFLTSISSLIKTKYFLFHPNWEKENALSKVNLWNQKIANVFPQCSIVIEKRLSRIMTIIKHSCAILEAAICFQYDSVFLAKYINLWLYIYHNMYDFVFMAIWIYYVDSLVILSNALCRGISIKFPQYPDI